MSLISTVTVFEATRFHCTQRTDQCTVAVISFKREREREGGSPLHMRQQDLMVHELGTDLGPGGHVAGQGSVHPDRIGHSGSDSPDSSGGPAPRCGGDCPGCGIPGERSPPVSGSV